MPFCSYSEDQSIVCQDIIRNAFDNEEYFDFTFTFEDGQVIRCVRDIARKLSSYLKTMLSENWAKQDNVEVKEYTYTVFYRYLSFLHTSELSLDKFDDIVQLYDLAKCCLEDNLEKACIETFTLCIDTSNCCNIFQFAIDHDLNKLRNDAYKYMSTNFESIVNSDQYKNLPASTLRVFIGKLKGYYIEFI